MRNVLILLAGAALFTGCASNGREEEEEVPTTLDAVPAAVRETIRAESGGAPVGKIVQETENGKTVYEATIAKNGKAYDVEIDESGKVLEREEADAEDTDSRDNPEEGR
jgi:uncharacterized membrane protein YkoI